MITVKANEAQPNFEALLEDVAQSPTPVLIIGERANAILICEGVWRAAQETIHLLGIAGMRDSIIEGMATPLSECADEVNW